MNSIFEKSLILLERINVEGFDGFRPNPETGQMLRPQQVVAIRQILHLMYHENIKYISLTAPTGSGKSIIGAVLAKIVYELEGGKTNLTTSSRALQKQYGNSLKVDEDFKVVMGTTNYKCSFFVDSKRRRYTAAESPCRDYKAYFDDHWDERIFPNQDDPNDMIKTIHEDQDEEIVTNLSNSEVLIENDMEEHREKLPKNKKDELLIYSMKTSCTEHGACSFYKARGAADEAPVAIRSIQHLMFYIMYQVGGIMPVLQERDLHIHDESHSIESVFREFFSVQFSELSYQDILSRINSSRRINLQIIESFSGIHKKEVSQWNGVDVYIACKTIEENLAKVVEKTAMVDENMLRSDKLTSAFEYAKAMGAGELMSDPDMIDEDVRKIVRWYKNIHHANSDQKFYLRQKEKGHRYNKKYGAQVKVDGRTTSINIYPISLEGMALRYFGTRNTVFMSATPLSGKVFENMFGLVGKVGYVEIESDFPTQRSPIFYDPVVTNTIDG
jgi:Rad3-related DNA helicase